MTIADLLALVRAPDWHENLGVCEVYYWGRTYSAERIARVSLSTGESGKHPFCLVVGKGPRIYDPRVIETLVRDPAWRRKYGVER